MLKNAPIITQVLVALTLFAVSMYPFIRTMSNMEKVYMMPTEGERSILGFLGWKNDQIFRSLLLTLKERLVVFVLGFIGGVVFLASFVPK